MSDINYAHEFEFLFAVYKSGTPDASDLTIEDVREAILKRLDQLCDNKELLEAIGDPVDSYEW